MQKSEYLDLAKASDLKNKKDRSLYRLFETIPALLSLATLAGVFLFSYFVPSWVSIFVICFCFYYLFRIFYFSLHQVVGYLRVKQHMKINWTKKLGEVTDKNWHDIYHVVVLPSYKEGKELIRESLDSLLKTSYPKDKLIIALAVEQRAGKEFTENAKLIAEEYQDKFFKVLYFSHPDHLAGEIAGKGSNVSYAGRELKKVIDELHIPYEHILISTFDIDTKVYDQYFDCVTYYYLTENDPLHASYQPVPVYNNNIWNAPFFARVVSTSNTFWQMIQQERAEKLTTYSSHTIPAKTFFEVGYPANVVQDDSRMFWKAYLYYDGNYRVVPIYYMVSMDAVQAKNLWRTMVNQYKQQKRWAWGCSEIPYLLFAFKQNKHIPLGEKISHLYTIIDGFWSWATAALLLFLLGWLPILLGGSKFNFTVLSFNLPILTSRIMTISMIGMVISAMLSTVLLPPLPVGMHPLVKFRKRTFVFLQWIFLPITLIVFGAFPALDAQIRLMLGKYMGFWVTEKVRK
jgi:hypothetical protein